ncbi:MAG: hypothetical protein ACTHU0_22320 [Kofleriaceae bacterium]
MRGRLIFPFLAELARLDTQGIAEGDPDGAGPLASGYDPDFREGVLLDDDDDGIGERHRRELALVRLPCQVEPEVFDALRLFAAGNAPRSNIDLVFHFRDLEALGLVDATSGDAMLRPGDRLVGLLDTHGVLVQRIRNPPGLYVTEARPIGFGLDLRRPRRNLLLVSFHDRPQGTARTA